MVLRCRRNGVQWLGLPQNRQRASVKTIIAHPRISLDRMAPIYFRKCPKRSTPILVIIAESRQSSALCETWTS